MSELMKMVPDSELPQDEVDQLFEAMVAKQRLMYELGKIQIAAMQTGYEEVGEE